MTLYKMFEWLTNDLFKFNRSHNTKAINCSAVKKLRVNIKKYILNDLSKTRSLSTKESQRIFWVIFFLCWSKKPRCLTKHNAFTEVSFEWPRIHLRIFGKSTVKNFNGRINALYRGWKYWTGASKMKREFFFLQKLWKSILNIQYFTFMYSLWLFWGLFIVQKTCLHVY